MTNFYKDKQQTINWLEKHDVTKYILVSDEKYGLIINVNGDVNLSFKNLINMPVKFNEINGNFDCSNNQLIYLIFCPQTIQGSFDCSENKLTSLIFCPQKVRDSFYCDNNELASLEFIPQAVGGDFCCHNNKKLKINQKITDFNLIYLEHKKALITKFSGKLENDLINDNSKKNAKIKI